MFYLFYIIFYKMITKKWEVSMKGIANQSYRQLHKVERTLDSLEKWNFIKRWLCKDAIETLKEQKNFIKKTIKNQEDFYLFKHLSSLHSSEVKNIVKENKNLENRITKGKWLGYTSKKEEVHKPYTAEPLIPFEEGCKIEKPAWYTRTFIKPKELKGNITFTQVKKTWRGRPKGKPRWPRKTNVLAKDLM